MTYLTPQFTRRTALKWTLTAVVISGFPAMLGGCKLINRAPLDLISKRMVDMLHYHDKVLALGEIYLLKAPDLKGQTLEQLTKQVLLACHLDHNDLTNDTLFKLDDGIRKQVHQDFIDENIVILKGWMLSKTEAMLCAMISLHFSKLA